MTDATYNDEATQEFKTALTDSGATDAFCEFFDRLEEHEITYQLGRSRLADGSYELVLRLSCEPEQFFRFLLRECDQLTLEL